jgi:hypothetical protein
MGAAHRAAARAMLHCVAAGMRGGEATSSHMALRNIAAHGCGLASLPLKDHNNIKTQRDVRVATACGGFISP